MKHPVMLGRLIVAIALVLSAMAMPAQATQHFWEIGEIYSNDDGTVQFIELYNWTNFEDFVNGHAVEAHNSDDTQTHTFTFDRNLSTDQTADTYLLLATVGFANIPNLPTPDFTIADGFLFQPGGTLDLPFATDSFNPTLAYTNLPTDGIHSLLVDGTVAVNSPTNFNGDTGTVPEPASLAMLGLGAGLILVRRRRAVC